MAQVYYLHCKHCGEPLTQSPSPYCPPCNLSLCYRAMPILLGMLMTSELVPVGPQRREPGARKAYAHLRDIMD